MAEPTPSGKIFRSPAFFAGILGACLVIGASFLPLIERADAPTLLLITGAIDPGLAVIVLAGPDVDLADLFAVYNGILPAGMTTTRMVEVTTLLDGMSPAAGTRVLLAGLVLMRLAPALRHVATGRDGAEPSLGGFTASPRSRSINHAGADPAEGDGDETGNMPVDDLRIFDDDMDQALSFTYRDPVGREPHIRSSRPPPVIGTRPISCAATRATGALRDFAADHLHDIVDRASFTSGDVA